MRKRLSAILGPIAAIWRPRRSLRGKVMLVVLAITFFALSVAGAILLVTELRDSHRAWLSELGTEADILSLATAPALSFDDKESGTRNLVALQARRDISGAALYRPDGTVFAQYRRPGKAPLPPEASLAVTVIKEDWEKAELLRPVLQNGETIGFVYLRGELDMSGRVRAYAGVLGVVLIVSMVFALLMSGWLQRVITEPMDSIARVARGVVDNRDYELRAQQTSEDEIGIVVAAFNRMLDEVQARTRDLEKANEALHESQKLYRAIGESIEYGVWVCDAEGRNTYASSSFLRLTGLTQEECSDFKWSDRLHPEDREGTIQAWKACVQRGSTWYREHRILGADGTYHSILAQGVPIRGEDDRITSWAGINLDISRLKRTEQALRDADRRKDEFLATLAHELRNPLAPIRNAVTILSVDTADDRQKQWGREVIARQVRRMALLLDDLLDVSRITRGHLQLRKEFVDLQSIIDHAVETARPLIESKKHRLNINNSAGNLRLEADPLRLSQILGNLLTNAAKYTDPCGTITLTTSTQGGGLFFSVQDTGVGLKHDSISSLFTMFFQVATSLDRTEGGLGIGLGLVKGLVELHGGEVSAKSEGLGRGSEFLVRLPPSIIARTGAISTPAEADTVVMLAERRKTILVADDNRDGAESLSMFLKLKGFDVLLAYSGLEALKVAQRERPSVILLDIGMPGLTGYEVARRIRLEAWGRDSVLIAVTGWGQADDKQNAMSAGFDEHLTKPVDPATLEQVLSRLVSSAQAQTKSQIKC